MSDSDHVLLRDALAEFWRVNNYGVDGGVSARWVKIVLKPTPLFIYMPNFDARRRALALHDIHHLTTGYGTDPIGEAEIAAWEIGGSCRGYWAAWLFNGLAFMYGWWLLPRRSCRAFVRGRHTRNLYDQAYRDALLDESVGEMRRRLGLDQPAPAPTTTDRLVYAAWCGAASLALVGGLAVVAAVLFIVLQALR